MDGFPVHSRKIPGKQKNSTPSRFLSLCLCNKTLRLFQHTFGTHTQKKPLPIGYKSGFRIHSWRTGDCLGSRGVF